MTTSPNPTPTTGAERPSSKVWLYILATAFVIAVVVTGFLEWRSVDPQVSVDATIEAHEAVTQVLGEGLGLDPETTVIFGGYCGFLGLEAGSARQLTYVSIWETPSSFPPGAVGTAFDKLADDLDTGWERTTTATGVTVSSLTGGEKRRTAPVFTTYVNSFDNNTVSVKTASGCISKANIEELGLRDLLTPNPCLADRCVSGPTLD